ncbi:hypothetical protein AD006_31110 (plasmid) [Pseudonocardia sp. EC080610-09]|nr:hypothetical protein AD006_31110 [Pseudonocardia sp. EC080610-09]ALL85407.1 hypothetical protein AD017_30120 [Pseudonocardia sp. EC080619-01]
MTAPPTTGRVPDGPGRRRLPWSVLLLALLLPVAMGCLPGPEATAGPAASAIGASATAVVPTAAEQDHDGCPLQPLCPHDAGQDHAPDDAPPRLAGPAPSDLLCPSAQGVDGIRGESGTATVPRGEPIVLPAVRTPVSVLCVDRN